MKQPVKQFTSWSYSRYADYRQCPLAASLKHLHKVQAPTNAAMTRGGEIGKSAEEYIKGGKAPLRAELKSFAKDFKEFRTLYKKLNLKPAVKELGPALTKAAKTKPGQLHPMTVEDTWAFTKDWTQTTWNDWVGCWVRIKLDCAHEVKGQVLIVTDFKTGKFRPEMNETYIEQLELYALGALLRHPLIKKVKPRLMYTDAGAIYPPNPDDMVFTQADVPKLKALWDKRTRAMLMDKKFAPRPNDKCHWCFYGQSGKANGGPGLCKF